MKDSIRIFSKQYTFGSILFQITVLRKKNETNVHLHRIYIFNQSLLSNEMTRVYCTTNNIQVPKQFSTQNTLQRIYRVLP